MRTGDMAAGPSPRNPTRVQNYITTSKAAFLVSNQAGRRSVAVGAWAMLAR